MVRLWAIENGPGLVGERAQPWLTKLAQSGHREIRPSALLALASLGPEAVRPLLPKLRKQLWALDHLDALAAAWGLTVARDTGALDEMRRRAASWDEGIYYRKQLETAIAVLQGDGNSLVERVKGHDHEAMQWLTHALGILLATAEAQAALDWASDNLPDWQCRAACTKFLIEGRWDVPMSSERLARKTRLTMLEALPGLLPVLADDLVAFSHGEISMYMLFVLDTRGRDTETQLPVFLTVKEARAAAGSIAEASEPKPIMRRLVAVAKKQRALQSQASARS